MAIEFNQQLQHASAWLSQDFSQLNHWADQLTAQELQELQAAAKALPADSQQWLALTPAQLNTPSLSARLDAITQRLEHGSGKALLRGIPVQNIDEDMQNRLYWVIALNLGNVIPQNAMGELIGAVQNERVGEINADTRGYVSNHELRFHCDGGDVAALLCVRQSKHGGENGLVSLMSVHNTMLQECPEHLATLYNGFPLYVRKEKTQTAQAAEKLGQVQQRRLPTFYAHDGRLSAFSNWRLAELAYEAAGQVMPDNERAALDAMEEIAERPTHKLAFKLSPGDMLFTHNLTCMHKRTAFEDDSPEHKRLMLRLWYNMRDSRKVNDSFDAYGPRRGFGGVAPVIRAGFY